MVITLKETRDMAFGIAKANPWFAPSVTDIRMLRIEDNNDLMPAVKKAVS